MSTNEEKIRQAIEILNNLLKDIGVARQVKEACKDAISYLNDKKITSYGIRAANSISRIEEVTQDPTVPPYIRTTLWKVISILEQVKD
ncbi:MAG: UPF0147 family protein [Thermoproteota archaeon]|jgi:Uncharacterized protein conserved in archaea